MNSRQIALLLSVFSFAMGCQNSSLEKSSPDTPQDSSVDQPADGTHDLSTRLDSTRDLASDQKDASKDDGHLLMDQTQDEIKDDATTQPPVQSWLVGEQGWTNIALPSTTGQVQARFFMRAQQENIDGTVGFSLGHADKYADLGVIVRMNEQGLMDVRDGSDYAADASLVYAAGQPMMVEVQADLITKTYTTWITAPDGQRTLLKANASLRTEQQGLSAVDNVGYLEPQGKLDIGDLSINGVNVDLIPATPPANVPLWSLNFQNSPVGNYTESDIRRDWEGTEWANPKDHAEIIDEAGNRFVRITYIQGMVGPNGGAQWSTNFARAGRGPFDELYVSYKMRFRQGFNWVKGGKLPGLRGGTGNTGGDKPNGSDGWSGRMMWRRGGEVVQYVYHPDQPTIYGDDFHWSQSGANLSFPTNTWITVEHRITMNTPGQYDGIVQGWYNGQLSLNRTNIRFRDVNTFAVDGFYFSTFFGGGSLDWSPPRDEYIDFDDFAFSDRPITH